MKLTLSWLFSHLETTASLAEICDKLTAIGLEVEAVDNKAEALAPFRIAEIRHTAPHPEAQKLQICRVWDGVDEQQIICGAANARTGLKVVLAPIGTRIPANGMIIKKAAIRGIESCGMLCSEEELGLADSSEGILELPSDAPVGAAYANWAGLDDALIEVNLTPNRADCTGVRGIARDLAASGLGHLKPLTIPTIAATKPNPMGLAIADDGNSCRQFIGRAILGVTNKASPDWMQKRLMTIGQKPISALVDITNYLTHDLGRPAHVYDLDRITSPITARRAKDGESLAALNGKSYQLKPSHNVIADAKAPVGIAGIIGGSESGCTAETNNIFLEIAYFDPAGTALTGRDLAIDSDARYRFERGADPAFLADATALATQLILDICGGTACEQVVAGHNPHQPRHISFNPARIASLGGVALDHDAAANILKTLGFHVDASQKQAWQVTVPSWRGDVHGTADLVEEILRIAGYQIIPSEALPPLPITARPALPLPLERSRRARGALAALGMLETHSWSFLHHDIATRFGGGSEALQLLNPISSDLDCMRPSLLPNLLQMTRRNQERGFDHIALCEVGLTYATPAPDGQATVASGVRAGYYTDPNPHGGEREADCFDAKADAMAALSACDAPMASLSISRDAPDWYHPGRSGAFKLGKQALAYFGELHPGMLQELGIKTRVVGFEVFLDAIPAPRRSSSTRPSYRPQDLQPVHRDFSFLLPEDSLSGLLLTAIEKADRSLITRATLVSCYQDAALKAESLVSLAVRVTLQPQEKSFTEADINALSQTIMLAALTINGCRLSPALRTYAEQKGMGEVLAKGQV